METRLISAHIDSAGDDRVDRFVSMRGTGIRCLRASDEECAVTIADLCGVIGPLGQKRKV